MDLRTRDRNLWKNFGREHANKRSRWGNGSELSSPNFNLSVRAEWSFAICYLNVVIKPLHGNFDICLNYYRSRPKVKDAFWIAIFSHSLAQFSRFRSRKARAHEIDLLTKPAFKNWLTDSSLYDDWYYSFNPIIECLIWVSICLLPYPGQC